MQHVQLDSPFSLEDWQKGLYAVDSATTFHTHADTFQGPQKLDITPELKQILDDFGSQSLKGNFAVRHGMVEGVWLDEFHNYIATAFSKATGDEDDFVMINSIG
jgi:hypothetical protein